MLCLIIVMQHVLVSGLRWPAQSVYAQQRGM